MKITHTKIESNKSVSPSKRRVYAADENVFEGMGDNPDPDFDEAEAEDLTDDMGEDGQQDGSTIEIDNNIVNHLIAECQNCHGIFISAMIASDQSVESINGVCPLCNKDTEQSLKWIIKDYPEEE